MKALLYSIGTRGDIEPFLTIAELLKKKGWDVICVFPEQFRETIEELNLGFRGFDKAFLEMLEQQDGKQFLSGTGSFFKRAGIILRMAKKGMKLSKDIIALQHRTLMEEKPDKVIYHPKCNFSIVWSMANPGKAIMVSPLPGMAHPVDHMTVLGGNHGRFLNRLFYWFVNTVKAVVIKKVAMKYRKDYYGTAITVSAIKTAMLENEKTFYAISPTLFPRPPYWPPAARVVGHYERDKTVNWQPDEKLQAFMRREKIILITFGSMPNSNPAEKSRIIAEVLKRNNVSAIINTSWGGLEKIDDCPDHIYFTDNIPYDWLLPNVYAVVHHGGSGTTHMALKHGCPCLIIPHALDQFFWARTVSALQLGPESLPMKKFNERNFETRLLELISHATYKTNAQTVSEKMKTESDPEKLYEMIVS